MVRNWGNIGLLLPFCNYQIKHVPIQHIANSKRKQNKGKINKY